MLSVNPHPAKKKEKKKKKKEHYKILFEVQIMQNGKLAEFPPLAFAWSDVSNCSIHPTLFHKEESKRQVNYNM